MEAIRKLILAVFAQLLLVTLIERWKELFFQYPVTSILLCLLYEAVIFLLTFGKEIWLKLKPDLVQYIVDEIKTYVGSFGPGFLRSYKRYVINEHGIFNVRGLGLINTFTLELEQVFVDLRIAPSNNPQQTSSGVIGATELTGNRPIWDFLRTDKIKRLENPALAIIGAPGCGKTTLLQHIAMNFAADRHRRFHANRYIPILLFLRDHISTIIQEQPPPISTLVEEYFSDRNLFPGLSVPRGWFEKQIDRGKCIFLLDGLDEVAELQQRQLISIWVDNQIKSFPKCRFILTARPQGYRDAPLQRAHVLEVQPFNMEQVRTFIENWYLANEVMSSGGQLNSGVHHRANKGATDLQQRLRKTPALNALTVNPLLLTMIAMVHRYHGALPGSRVELYSEICEVLLGRWRLAKGVKDSLNASQKLVVIRPLASFMMENKLRNIPVGKAAEIIDPYLQRVESTHDTAEKFLSELQSSSGLIQEREAGLISFAHLTFQEYLTAKHWLEQKKSIDDLPAKVADSWWHETFRLYAAQGDPTKIIQACLRVDSVSTLGLAGDCVDEARELDASVRQNVFDRLIEDIESTDSARRRLASEVRLSRRLKSLQRIDDDSSIDLDYLSCSEYQIFLDDMRQQGEHHQPDHWRDLIFEREHGFDPISGLRYEDTLAFCEWLALREGGSVRYRLPTTEEASKYPAKKSEKLNQKNSQVMNVLGTWCSNDGVPFLMGLEKSTERNIRELIARDSHNSLPSPTKYCFTIEENLRQSIAFYNIPENALASFLALYRFICSSRLEEASSWVYQKSFIKRIVEVCLAFLQFITRPKINEFPLPGNRKSRIEKTRLSLETPSSDDEFVILDKWRLSARNSLSLGTGIITAVTVIVLSTTDTLLLPSIIIIAAGILLLITSYVYQELAKFLTIYKFMNLEQTMDREADNSGQNIPSEGAEQKVTNAYFSADKLNERLYSARALASMLDLNYRVDFPRAFDRGLGLQKERALARIDALARNPLNNLSEEFIRSIEGRDFSLAKELLLELDLPENHEKQFFKVVGYVISAAEAQTPYEAHIAEGMYMARIIESLLIGYGNLPNAETGFKLFKWFRSSKEVKNVRKQQEMLLELYWWLQILSARAGSPGKNEMTCWDGFRIVREQN